MKKFIFFLDMDGVCCNFLKGVLEVLGLEHLEQQWPKGREKIGDVLGLPMNQIWNLIDQNKEHFWRNLEEYPWFKEMYSLLQKKGEVVFLTTPNRSPYSHMGKVLWLQDRFGIEFDNYILTKHKHFCAGTPNSVLIDDRQKKIIKQLSHNGKAILFPNIQNELHYVKDKTQYLMEKINELFNM